MKRVKRRKQPYQTSIVTPTDRPASMKPVGVRLNFEGHHCPEAWPAVSLCMIVKNEAENLAACLASVGDLASEVIIVDTGSTDQTVEIARSLGATVRHFPWINDFAAARNESIREASSEWIFWMDADDRLSPENLNRLKQALVSGQADVYACQIASADQGKQTGTEHWRLFRNHMGLHFERPLHETVLPLAAKLGLRLAVTNVVIDHTGYQVDADGLKAKARRNLAIIQEVLAHQPDDLHWRYHYGVCLAVLEQYEAAAEAYEAVIARPPATLHWDMDIYQAHVSLMEAYVKTKRWEEARRVLRQALEHFPARRHLAIAAGVFYLLIDEPEQAIEHLERAKTLATSSDRVGHAWSSGKLEAELGYAQVLIGNLPCAKQAYQAMLAAQGNAKQSLSPATWLQVKHLAPAVQVELLNPSAQGDPTALRWLVQAEKQQQHWDSAARYLAQAIALSQPQPGEWITLAELVLRSGKLSSAKRLANLALTENSQQADALNLLALIAIQSSNFEQAMIYLVQTLLVNPQHLSANHNLEQIAQGLSLSPADAIRQHGLRLIQQQLYGPASQAFALLITFQPQDIEAYKSLAVALQGLGRGEDALLAWRMAERLNS
ncbi:MAG: glycosyltransferase [Anaerolineae bacterium]